MIVLKSEDAKHLLEVLDIVILVSKPYKAESMMHWCEETKKEIQRQFSLKGKNGLPEETKKEIKQRVGKVCTE